MESTTDCKIEDSIPKIIFIVPYRDRENQKSLFLRQMNYVLEDIPKTDYKIYFSEQCDTRNFNRGAMRNIGFLAMKNKYPNHYKNITFVFNDVDTMPYRKNYLNYETKENIVKHFYGHYITLGGIVSILGSDFEKINGYPNFWYWGYEDNALQVRVQKNNISIDRGQFHPVLNNEIIQCVDVIYKKVNKKEFLSYKNHTVDGIDTLQSINYTIDEENNTIRVNYFMTPLLPDSESSKYYNITSSENPFDNKLRKGSIPLLFSQN